MSNKANSAPAGAVDVHTQLREASHETMKLLKQIRHRLECSDVRLNRIYQEAVDQYINAKPQQKLLKEFADGVAKPDQASAARVAGRM